MRVDINFAAMILLGIVCVITYQRLDMKDQLNRVFLITSLVVIVELFFEAASCVLNRRTEPWAAPASTALHICLYTMGPVLAYFWYLMIIRWISPEKGAHKGKNFVLLALIAVNLTITFLSPAYGLAFSIDSANVYHRGPYYPLYMTVLYIFFIYSLVLLLKRRKVVATEEFFSLVAAVILPMAGGLLQVLFYGVLLMWSCAGFSLVIIYIYLQQRMVHLDDLTGAWMRGTFDYHIMQRLKLKANQAFGLILLDIDNLKQINDKYGHFEGDYALRMTVQLVKSALRKTDIVARTGGDEFMIIIECGSQEELDQAADRIKTALYKHNETAHKEYLLDCSMGAELFRPDIQDIEPFKRHVDWLMYKNKREKKR
ncbi:MAG TPA: diguanylate cyclase [Bacillota bacterium]|nr:diguanylate cyclase [Bacillota bacterium]